MPPFRTRFAPTPSGFLHPGNGISFILTWAIARAADGHILLRIDDLDKARFRQEYLEDIFETLDWLGLDYDQGPASVADFMANWSQHRRLETYTAALDQLRENGLLFACDCTRKQIREQSEDGLYPGRCLDRQLAYDRKDVSWRVALQEPTKVSFHDWRWGHRILDLAGDVGNFVVRQKNGFPAYQIASLVDDREYDINFIVRGKDLLSSTAAQLYLAKLLEWPAFQQATFWHHPLLMDDDGGKLSKSAGATSLRSWRNGGRSTGSLFEKASEWLQLKHRCTTGTELVAALKELGELPLSSRS